MKIDPASVLSKLVSFDTTNMGPDKKPGPECPEYINSLFEEFDFQTELHDSEGFWTSFARKGQGQFKILFIAHYDVVPVGEGWDTDPFKLEVDGDRAYGRGTCDDKGNIVSMLLLAESLSQTDFPCSVMMATTGDEEIGGKNGALYLSKYLARQGLYPDYIIVADGIGQQIIHRRRNILPSFFKAKSSEKRMKGRVETIRFTTETFGSDTRHSAYLRPGVDRHAMLAASKYIDLHPGVVVSEIRGPFLKTNVVPDWVELDLVIPDDSVREELKYDATLTGFMQLLLSISQASFPTKPSDKGTMIWPNILRLDSDLWTLVCDVRAMTNDDEAVHQAFEAAIDGRLDLFTLKVHPGIGYVDVDPASRLIRAAEWALQKEGIKYKVTEGFGASDSRYFAGERTELFDFGPRGDNLHGSNEWVSLSSLEENANFFYTLLEVLSREKSPV